MFLKGQYEYYLPQLAGIGFVQKQKLETSGYERHYGKFDGISIRECKIGKEGYTGYFQYPSYVGPTYQITSEIIPNFNVLVPEVKAIFTYVGTEPFKVTNENFYEMHPCRVRNGKRVNEHLYIFSDILHELYPFDVSYQRRLKAVTGNVFEIKVVNEFRGTINKHHTFNKPSVANSVPIPDHEQTSKAPMKFVFLSDVKAAAALIITSDNEANPPFWLDMRFRDRLFLKLPTSIWMAKIYLFASEEHEHDISLMTSVVQGTWHELGGCLSPVKSHAQANYERVMVDGIYRDKLTNLHEVWDTSISVPEENLQEVEYLLKRASSEDCVFHIGTSDPRLDQKVFLGKLEYDAPINNDLSYEFAINGQTLPMLIDNKFTPNDGMDEWK